jgi:predicted site-specific integrase-resolvase
MIDSELKARLEAALKSNKPKIDLINIVKQMKDKDMEQKTVYDIFEEYRKSLKDAKRKDDEEIVKDVIDIIIGLCSPRMRIYPKVLNL